MAGLILLATVLSGCRLTEQDRGLVESIGASVDNNAQGIRGISEALQADRAASEASQQALDERLVALEARLDRLAADAGQDRAQRAEALAMAQREAGSAVEARIASTGETLAQQVGEVDRRLNDLGQWMEARAEEAGVRFQREEEVHAKFEDRLGRMGEGLGASVVGVTEARKHFDRHATEQNQRIDVVLQQLEKLGGNSSALTARQETITKAVKDLDAALARLSETQASYEAQVRAQVDKIAKQDGQAMETLRLGTAARLSAIETELQESRAALMQQGEELIPAVRELKDRLAKVESLAQAALDEAKKAAARVDKPSEKKEGGEGGDGDGGATEARPVRFEPR